MNFIPVVRSRYFANKLKVMFVLSIRLVDLSFDFILAALETLPPWGRPQVALRLAIDPGPDRPPPESVLAHRTPVIGVTDNSVYKYPDSVNPYAFMLIGAPHCIFNSLRGVKSVAHNSRAVWTSSPQYTTSHKIHNDRVRYGLVWLSCLGPIRNSAAVSSC